MFNFLLNWLPISARTIYSIAVLACAGTDLGTWLIRCLALVGRWMAATVFLRSLHVFVPPLSQLLSTLGS